MSLLQIMFLGQVITKNNTIETLDFINVTSDTAVSDNATIYTLVIGKQLAETLYGKENVHILDKTILHGGLMQKMKSIRNMMRE